MQKLILRQSTLEDFEETINKYLNDGYVLISDSIKIIPTPNGSCCAALVEEKVSFRGYHVKVGTDTFPASQEDIEGVMKQLTHFEQSPDFEYLVTHHAVEFKPLYKAKS